MIALICGSEGFLSPEEEKFPIYYYMCRSFGSSVVTAAYSYLIAAFIYWRNHEIDRQISLIIFTFSSIQILEAMIWWSLQYPNQYSDILNRVGTSLIPVVLSLELLASLLVMSRHVAPSKNELVAYIIAISLINILWFTNKEPTTTVDPETQSLLWGQTDIDQHSRILFLLFLVYPLLKLSHPTFLAFAYGIIATFVFSFKYKKTFGSNWCWISNLLSTFALIKY